MAARGQGFARWCTGLPGGGVGHAQLATFEPALAGDLPSVLRRGWEDRLDDLR